MREISGINVIINQHLLSPCDTRFTNPGGTQLFLVDVCHVGYKNMGLGSGFSLKMEVLGTKIGKNLGLGS